MNPRTSRLSLLALAVACISGTDALAVAFDFSSDGQFAGNFHDYAVPNGSFAQSAASGRVTWTTSGGQTGAFVYDTNGATAGGTTNFIPGVGNSVVVNFDFSSNVLNTGFGVFFGGARNAEYLALFNLNNSGSNDQLRIFATNNWNATTPATGGTTSSPAASLATTTGTNGWTSGATYHATLTMTYTSATTADVTYVITDPSNVITPFSVSATGLTVSGTANEIGFRMGSAGNPAILSIDNLSIVTTSTIPEPSTFALLGGAGTLGLAVMQRRKRN